jgi:hypothetical protein
VADVTPQDQEYRAGQAVEVQRGFGDEWVRGRVESVFLSYFANSVVVRFDECPLPTDTVRGAFTPGVGIRHAR